MVAIGLTISIGIAHLLARTLEQTLATLATTYMPMARAALILLTTEAAVADALATEITLTAMVA
jgi:hypothetical protein